MIPALPTSMFWTRPLRSPWRLLMAVAAVVAAIAHGPVIGEHLSEAPYMGVMFILLTIACLALAAIALARDCAAVYVAAIAVCGLAVLGYAATRTFAFPMLADDVGNWLEPLGVLAIISELTVVVSAGRALRQTTRELRPLVRVVGRSREG
jgi:hypothetical protein